MIRSTGALLVRACREDSRLVQSHLFRMFFAAAVFGTFLIAIFLDPPVGAPGLSVFRWICWINAVCITFGAISYFSTVITEEKDDFTLGLLQMTGMGPLALLLGKSTSRLIVAILALCVQLPFVLLAITLGGILWHQIAFAYLALLAYLICTANLGLLVSVRCRASSGAARLMVVIFGVFYAGVPLLQWKLTDLRNLGVLNGAGWLDFALDGLLDRCAAQNVFMQINECVATGFVAPALGSEEIWINVIAGFVFFLLAWGTFERSTTRQQAAQSFFPSRWRFVKRTRRTSRRAWKNALVWKDFRFVAGGMKLTLAKFMLYGLLLVALDWYFPRDFVNAAWPVMILATSLEALIYASRVFSHEAREKTLPLLRMLPASWFSTCWSKVGGCLLGLVPAVCYLSWAMWLYETVHWTDPYRSGTFFGTPRSWLTPLMILILLHLTTYLSLLIKYGAIPVALLAVYCLEVKLQALYFGNVYDPTPLWVQVLLVSVVGVFVLHALAYGEFRKFASLPFAIHAVVFVGAAAAFYFGYGWTIAAFKSQWEHWPSEQKVFLVDMVLVQTTIALQLFIARRLRTIAAA